MYAHHAPVIAAGMREDPQIFARGVLFVILSIRQRVDRVPDQLREVHEQGPAATALFGWKRDAFYYLIAHHERLHADLTALPLNRPAAAIRTMLQVPGLGIVKAGFVAQLMGFNVACLDGRNLAAEGYSNREFRTDKSSPRQVTRQLRRYLKKTRGRAEEYWDKWCEGVGQQYGYTAEHVSEIHMEILPDDYIPF